MAIDNPLATTLAGFPGGQISGTCFSRASVIVAPSAGQTIAIADNQRIGLYICSSSAGAAITNDPGLASQANGLLIPSNSLLELTLRDHGPLCQEEWLHCNTGVGANYAVFEVILIGSKPSKFTGPEKPHSPRNILEAIKHAIRRLRHDN